MKPHVTVLLLTLLLFLLLLLLSTFMLLFYLLVDAHCQKAHAALYRKLEAVFINVDMSDFASCVEQAMWFICHLNFPVCKFDKIRKNVEKNSNMQEQLLKLQKNSIM